MSVVDYVSTARGQPLPTRCCW